MALTFLKEYFNKNVARVQSVENPKERYYIINMTIPEKMQWNAGDYALFSFYDRTSSHFLKFHSFYIGSIPKENRLMIGMKTKNPPHLFEEKVLAVQKEDRVKIKGPFGSSIIEDTRNRPLILMTNGINITPIRALLKNLESDFSRPIALIYTSRDYHLFREELDKIAAKNTTIQIFYVFDRSESSSVLEQLVQKYGNNAFYCIYGSDKTINHTKKTLKQLTIHKKQVIINHLNHY